MKMILAAHLEIQFGSQNIKIQSETNLTVIVVLIPLRIGYMNQYGNSVQDANSGLRRCVQLKAHHMNY